MRERSTPPSVHRNGERGGREPNPESAASWPLAALLTLQTAPAVASGWLLAAAGREQVALQASQRGSFLGDEQVVNLLVAQLFLAVLAVDDQHVTAGRHPHDVVAKLEHVLDLRLALQHAEVGVALRLDGDGL